MKIDIKKRAMKIIILIEIMQTFVYIVYTDQYFYRTSLENF